MRRTLPLRTTCNRRAAASFERWCLTNPETDNTVESPTEPEIRVEGEARLGVGPEATKIDLDRIDKEESSLRNPRLNIF